MKTTEDEDTGVSCLHGCFYACLTQLICLLIFSLCLTAHLTEWSLSEIVIPVTRQTIAGGSFLMAVILLCGLVYSMLVDPLKPRGRR